MTLAFGPRRAIYIDIAHEAGDSSPLGDDAVAYCESFDLVYRSLCSLMFNYVPMSGHPGGSISSGRFVARLLFGALDYDVADPDRAEADIVSYAAGHKALGLYAMWALRNEVARIAAPDLLPADQRLQLRLEDLLGFRRNPTTRTPLFMHHKAKALDGHPTPATPFLRLATGASGVGVASSLGLAFGARDYYGANAPRIHIVEGEGGLTPGRVSEALAAAGTASLGNVVLHLDWNQASIDSDHVCREDDQPGDYVQWSPAELFYLHDWNVVFVPDGRDFGQIAAAQQRALAIDNSQPTAIVYRTTKGWQYGIEGRASHGAGHPLCSDAFFQSVETLATLMGEELPTCCEGEQRCAEAGGEEIREQCYWDALQIVRRSLESQPATVEYLARGLQDARSRLAGRGLAPRRPDMDVARVYELAAREGGAIPAALRLVPGTATTLRGELGRAFDYLNRGSGGSIIAAAADLLGSTSINAVGAGFEPGFYNAVTNPDARLLATGGICEDAMMGILAGLSTYGRHIGAGSSYGAFIAALGHIPARLHAIGGMARREIAPDPYRPVFLVCAHTGVKTGEDGPTHADPQPLQLLQENFPTGTMVTLTPWDPQEVWPLVAAALARRPAVIAPFVTRPTEIVPDRASLGMAPAEAAAQGVYLLRAARGTRNGTIVLQGSEVTYEFVRFALPMLERDGVDLDVYYVASVELFDLLPASERASIFAGDQAAEAMGITGFTLPTMYRWVTSEAGRALTMHPFQKGRFLGSGQADKVMAQGGLDGESQYRQVLKYAEGRRIPATV